MNELVNSSQENSMLIGANESEYYKETEVRQDELHFTRTSLTVMKVPL